MDGTLFKIYKKTILIFVGAEGESPLEHRIFNLFSFFVCTLAFCSFFLNLFFGLYESAILTSFVCLFQSAILYLSRIKQKFNLALILTGIELHLLLLINYPLNGGVQGPTVILFLAVLFLMISVAGPKSIWIWLVVNLSFMALLFSSEYFRPDWVLVGYSDRVTVFFDVYATYIMVVVLMATGILYERRAYGKQKKVLETKAFALEKLNTEKTKLFSIISHDLRAPIGSIKQYFSFLEEHSLSTEEKKIIESGLIKSTNEAYELLDNLLIWAKTQLGGSQTLITDLKVAEILETTLSQVETVAHIKDITLKVNIKDIEALADKHMLQLVIRNLLLNAVKFSRTGDFICFDVYEDNQKVLFKITDSGIGISEENKKAIFSLNVKSNLGTNKEKGTGLGLALCKEYTELQNGKIWFDSEFGSGSTFYVSLPVSNRII